MKNKIPVTRKLITIDKNQSLTDAMNVMSKESISHILVRDGVKIIGIITDWDIATTFANFRDLGTERKLKSAQFHVSSAMINDLKTIPSDEEITEAAKVMVENGFSSLPVAEDGKIIGIVTKTDLIKEVKDSKKGIETFYSKNAVTIPSGSSIVHARKVILEEKIHKILVTDNGKLIGILSEKDIANALREFRRALDKYRHADVRKITVDDFMKRDPLTLNRNATISDAVKIMVEHNTSGIPIVGETWGIITKTDIVKGIAEENLP